MSTRLSALFLALLPLWASAQDQPVVVVYVSHDQEHSEAILKAFEARTGIKVEPQFDTEDNKTVGLTSRILGERKAPVADVFWNNEFGQTERLKAEGLLEVYRSEATERIPAAFRDPDGTWTGFGARARVLVWNKELIKKEELPGKFEDLLDPKWKGRFAMARPLTGTTLTHIAALHALWGVERTEKFLDGLEANRPRWERGNAQVSRVVAEGTLPIGLTDTDDVHGRALEGSPVDKIYLDQEEGGLGTLVIPNTVMILKGCRHPDTARKLVDYLVSAEVEAALAAGRAAQMPLGPGAAVPAHVDPVASIRAMKVDYGAVGRSLDAFKSRLDQRYIEGAAGPPRKGQNILSGTLLWAAVALVVVVALAYLLLRPKRAGI